MSIARCVVVASALLSLFWPDPVVGRPEAAASESTPAAYQPPAGGVVVDGFRPPATGFGAGNLGWEYSTEPDGAVLAAADGEVLFAGQVGGTLHVTIGHSDGLRTSYSFVSGFSVRPGAKVVAGEVIARSAGSFHFGVRNGDEYIDPAILFGSELRSVRLIPVDGWAHDSLQRDNERSSLLGFIGSAGRRLGGVVANPAGAALGAGAALLPATSPFAHYATELLPMVRAARVVSEFADWRDRQRECTSASTAAVAPTERRVAVLVAGFHSTSTRAAVADVDVEALGYVETDVVRFSYRGGRVPARAGLDAGLDAIHANTYGSHDTTGDLEGAARRLSDLLEQVTSANPGVPVDVYAHSQGGVVAHLAMVDPWAPPPDEVDLVATMGSPHEGTDFATAAAAMERSPGGRAGLRAVARVWDPGVSRGSESSVLGMAETSTISLASQRPLPEGIRTLTLAAREDVVVPAGHTRVDGIDHRTLSVRGISAHSGLPGASETTRELVLALSGRAPTCESWIDGLTDAAVPEAISYGEDLLGAAAAGISIGLPATGYLAE